MPITKVPQAAHAMISYEDGINASGGTLTKSYRLSNVKAAATDVDIYAVADGIGSLQSKTVIEISRVDESVLLNS